MRIKRINNVRKEYLIVIVLALILVSVVIFNKAIIRTWYELTVDMECVEEKTRIEGHNYFHGYVLVTFNEDISEDEAKNLINQYGLTLDFNTISRVYVEYGSEIKWLCILERSELIKNVALDHEMQLA